MRPIARPDGHLLMGVSPDTRPPPSEFAEMFGHLAHVAHKTDLDKARAAAFLLMMRAADNAQVFDFGEIEEPRLIEEAKLGGSLMAQRTEAKGAPLLQLPYESVLYWYTLTNLQHEMQPVKMMLTTDEHSPTRVRYATLATMFEDEMFVADFMLLDAETSAIARRDILRHNKGSVVEELKRGRNLFLMSGLARLQATADCRWRGYLFDRPGDDTEEQRDKDSIGSLADGVAAMTMILATKGVGIRREPAPAKVNAKRERAGKPAYPAVTHVDTRAYFDAMRRTALGGTHASPVPHLRRGHVRTYSDGRRTWVRSALVNCRSVEDAQARDHYAVAV